MWCCDYMGFTNEQFQPFDQTRTDRSSKISGTVPERIEPEYTTHFLQGHVQEYIQQNWIPEIRKNGRQPVNVDYGCGDGTFTWFIHPHDGSERTIGYDPNLKLFPSYDKYIKEARPEERFKHPEYTADVNALPEVADIVTLHFSLHHLAETRDDLIKKLQEIVDRLQPQFIALAEFDCQGVSMADFKTMLNSEAGKREVNLFIEQLKSEGVNDDITNKAWQACMAYHQRFNREDCITALQEAGYSIEKILLPGEHAFRHEQNRFLAFARKNAIESNA